MAFLSGLEKVPTLTPLLLTTARTAHNAGFHVRYAPLMEIERSRHKRQREALFVLMPLFGKPPYSLDGLVSPS